MLSIISVELLSAVSIGLMLGLVVLLVLQILSSIRVNRMTYPVYEYALSKAEAEANHILHEAEEKARKIIADAEQKSTSLLDVKRKEIETAEETYRSALENLAGDLRQKIQARADTIGAQEEGMAAALAKSVTKTSEEIRTHAEAVEKSLDSLREHTEARAIKTEQVLSKGAEEASARMIAAFARAEEEGKRQIQEHSRALADKLEKEIADYRAARKRFIDEHAVELIENATKIVLRKELSADDHTKFALRALEEAKAMGVL